MDVIWTDRFRYDIEITWRLPVMPNLASAKLQYQ